MLFEAFLLLKRYRLYLGKFLKNLIKNKRIYRKFGRIKDLKLKYYECNN